MVKFIDTSNDGITSWNWDFGDGLTSKHSTNATHTYKESGVYDVTLTVTNSAGTDTKTMIGYIVVF